MSDSMKNLAMALSVKRRKKMAKGGKVMSDLDHGQKRGPEGFGKYQEQAQNEKGVHTPVSGVTAFPGAKGSSEAGTMATETYAGKPHRELRDHGKELHRKKLEEMRSMKKPNLKGLAEGGMVTEASHRPKMQAIKHPRMVPSSAFSTRLRDQEDHLERSAHPASPEEHIKMANGGVISDKAAEDDMVEHPAGLESDNDSMGDKDAMDDHMVMLAHGGELEEDHHDSIAAAIMAKRRRMAEGGQVDLDLNAMEQPEDFDARNEAILKENYDEDMHSVHEPMDSNEHGHELPDEDMHDMVSKIRSQMNKRRQFKG